MNRIHRVALVFDPHFGDRLVPLCETMHVWVCDTPDNRRVAERVWAAMERPSLERGISTFKASAEEFTDRLLSRTLSAIDLHHGEQSHEPPWACLHVYGLQATGAVVEALAEFGVTITECLADHFVAMR